MPGSLTDSHHPGAIRVLDEPRASVARQTDRRSDVCGSSSTTMIAGDNRLAHETCTNQPGWCRRWGTALGVECRSRMLSLARKLLQGGGMENER